MTPEPKGAFTHCAKCGSPLSLSDLIGTHHLTHFEVKGYRCPNPDCKYQSVKTYSKNRKINAVFFDWKKQAATSTKCRS